MEHEDLLLPTAEEIQNFKNLGKLFGNSNRIFFLRVSAMNSSKNIKAGDVLIADRDATCEKDELRIYLDRQNGRFVVSRTEHVFFSYWGKVLWVLKNVK